MNLHQNPEVFRDAITATAEALQIRDVYVEKDYWVTLVLYRLAHSPYVEQAIFKGGTSLSKAYNLIERFSEDIDLAINALEGMTNNQVMQLIRKISKEITKDMVEVNDPHRASKGSRFRKTLHEYGATVQGDYGQATDKILVEINSFASPNPHQLMPIKTYISQFMAQRGLLDLIRQYGLAPFEVNVVSLERTFTEKVLALVRASYAENPIDELGSKIRHVYDLHAMLKAPAVVSFLHSEDFFQMIKAVQADDARNSEFQGDWALHPLDACLLFADVGRAWKTLNSAYQQEFRSLVYGTLPDPEEIIAVLGTVAARLQVFGGRKS
ncbi:MULTISPECIES: nucleotidyl transferase AbiEii/AbiGii toxin family protein [Pontibacter]|uniref:Nucleotidyl transferase AbiEii/AbiGii toxin family protein n=2 Tax=Pontibacter TaxID=323449 RepID=A0A5C8KBN9_9BACT|nr:MULTISPECIES: nucleotidyl transferase AbiEii/AbiGii toxin family protein [Pontibacter]PVY38374.1 nucleotidyltransferase AbiEii toxin of type IV toxin-antitoxin system [Pontibacter virosus]TXK50078.1 nucleotidyl transferase AbiEii/AbiGii toxin family protein [Pontibacter qinzhouensis]